MKISALLLLLLAAAWVGSQGMSFRSRSQCCSREMFSSRKIPEQLIQGYQHTDPSCTHRAVLVKLQKGMVCVDPEKKWFQKFLRKQKQPNSTST
ncbi:CCL13 protein, partial [Erithacus rubecula]|nr:CCL13 protein [Erithacus rubecula]